MSTVEECRKAFELAQAREDAAYAAWRPVEAERIAAQLARMNTENSYNNSLRIARAGSTGEGQ